MPDLKKIIGERIRSIRKAKGFTQETLAEKADIHYSYIGGIERGDRNISVETLSKIINALEILPVELFQFTTIDDENEILSKRIAIESLNSSLLTHSVDEIKLIHRITEDIFNTMDKNKED
ncbi:helix-turn-helix domain-containing protein [Virgibacillus alimentarius]|uniref:helix-turn-helix domain-containing protein n=1 Tax=Virgibacillus alimentarius TaxID=698769 RepID=UPI000492F6E8|nr:helix-turn-helix transcriptional regulator [Virgibacillus alimentarius]